MRVLIITGYFPPDTAVGAIRAAAVHDAFRRAGHEVVVITRRLRGAPEHSGVHRVATLPNPRELALVVKQGWLRLFRHAPARTGPGGYRPPDDVPAWKRFLLAMALMPDDYQGFIGPAVLRALLLMTVRRCDLVYTSGPPHSVQLVGLALRTLVGVRWAAEFRDPWTDNAVTPRYGRSRAADRVRTWLERRCLRSADVVVSVTASAAAVLARKTGRENVIVARSGIDRQSLVAEPPRPRPLSAERRLLYMGNLYHRRDPRPLFRALGALRARGGLPAGGVRIDFFGECKWYQDVATAEAARRAGVGDLVHIHERVPLERARQLAREADLLLLLAQHQPLQVPQKLYEYLATGRPIIAFADAEGETAAILQEVGGHFVIPDGDGPRTEEILYAALHRESFEPPDRRVLEQLSAERVLDRLVHALTAPLPGSQPAPAGRGRTPAGVHG